MKRLSTARWYMFQNVFDSAIAAISTKKWDARWGDRWDLADDGARARLERRMVP